MFKWLRSGAGTMLREVWTFAREAGAAKVGEVVFKHTEEVFREDPRQAVMDTLRRLEKVQPEKAAKLYVRLDWAAKTNEPDFENNVMLALGHLLPRNKDKDVRWQEAVEVLEWVADMDDATFAVTVEAMKHDPIAHMARYLVNKKGVPALKYGMAYVWEAAKAGSEVVKNGLKTATEKFPELNEQADDAIFRFRASQKWLKRSRRRQDQLENQLLERSERQTRERVAESYDRFRRDWTGDRGGQR